MAAPDAAASAPPPRPASPHVLSAHGDDRVDDWYWLRDRDDPDVIAYLEAENALRRGGARADRAAARPHLRRDQAAGCRRPTSRRRSPTDRGSTPPARSRDSSTRSTAGGRGAAAPDDASSARRERARAPATTTSRSAASRSRPITACSPTPSTSTAASATRCASATSTPASTSPTSSTTSPTASRGPTTSRTCFYVRPDDAMRPNEVWRHRSARPPTDDVLVFREDDERFYLGVDRTRSGRFVLIDVVVEAHVGGRGSSRPTRPTAEPRVIAPREHGHEYTVEHHWSDDAGDRFLIVTNQGGARATSSSSPRRAPTPAASTGRRSSPTATTCASTPSTAFADHLVLSERAERPRTAPRDCASATATSTRSRCPIPCTACGSAPNAEYDTTHAPLRLHVAGRAGHRLRLRHRRPGTATRREGAAGARRLRPGAVHVGAAVGDRGRRHPDPDLGRAPPRHRRSTAPRPRCSYGYGSYEHSTDPAFRASRLSLLDRGFVFAIAHVRGGGEMGRAWYEDGRLEHKVNTFTDFIACAEHLVARELHVAGRGSSPAAGARAAC